MVIKNAQHIYNILSHGHGGLQAIVQCQAIMSVCRHKGFEPYRTMYVLNNPK